MSEGRSFQKESGNGLGTLVLRLNGVTSASTRAEARYIKDGFGPVARK